METPAGTTSKNPVNMRVWIIAAIVVIGIVLVLLNINKQPDEVSDQPVSEATVETESENGQTVSSSAQLVTATDPDQALVYTAALSKYAGRIITFNTRCQVSPTTVTYKSGTKIMLDNRGAVANDLIIGDLRFRIPAYNFAFLTLNPETLPATHSVSCADNINVASIKVI